MGVACGEEAAPPPVSGLTEAPAVAPAPASSATRTAQPAAAPASGDAPVPSAPADLVLAFLQVWERFLADYAGRPIPAFLGEAAALTFELKRPFLTPELAERERVLVDRLRQRAVAMPPPAYEVVSTEPAGPDAMAVTVRRETAGGKFRERLVDLVRRDGRWWIAQLHVRGKGTLPEELVRVGRLVTLPQERAWSDDRSTPEQAARNWAELFLRVRVAQSERYVLGVRRFIEALKRFGGADLAAGAEADLARAIEEGRAHAREFVCTPGPPTLTDASHAWFILELPAEAHRATRERVDLVKVGAEWRVGRIGVPHRFCGGGGRCPACEGSGRDARKGSACGACKGSGACSAGGCGGTGYVAAD
jgi:hypothetical protein